MCVEVRNEIEKRSETSMKGFVIQSVINVRDGFTRGRKG